MAQQLQPGDRYWKAIEPYWTPLCSSWDVGPEAFLEALQSVPEKSQHLFACHWCLSEVRNGGFLQFFHNSTGILAPEARKGFTALAASELAAILADAISYFGPNYPRDRVMRLTHLPPWLDHGREEWDPFRALDLRLYAWLDASRDRWELLADAYASAA
jgi:hypothetical protein